MEPVELDRDESVIQASNQQLAPAETPPRTAPRSHACRSASSIPCRRHSARKFAVFPPETTTTSAAATRSAGRSGIPDPDVLCLAVPARERVPEGIERCERRRQIGRGGRSQDPVRGRRRRGASEEEQVVEQRPGSPARKTQPPIATMCPGVGQVFSHACDRERSRRTFVRRVGGRLVRGSRRALRLRLRRGGAGRPRAARRQGRRARGDDRARRARSGRASRSRPTPAAPTWRAASSVPDGPRRRGGRAHRSARASDPGSGSAIRRIRCSSRCARAPRSRCPG